MGKGKVATLPKLSDVSPDLRGFQRLIHESGWLIARECFEGVHMLCLENEWLEQQHAND